jgi:hypothetical protein
MVDGNMSGAIRHRAGVTMPKMPITELQSMLGAQKADAMAAIQAAQLSQDRAQAMMYYEGDMSQDMPTVVGRSSAVSTDVSDTVEGLMPQLMDVICGSDEVIRFEPVGPEDEDAAQQEGDYVNHVLMQTNNGFKVVYDFAKDGLLAKNAFVKVWWEEREHEERETYYDLTEDQFAMVAQAVAESDGAMEIVEHSVNNEPKTEATS